MGLEGRIGAVLQLHGVLSVRAVAWPASAHRRLLPDLGRIQGRQWLLRRYRPFRAQSRADHGDSRIHEPRQLDCRPVRRQAGLDLRHQGFYQDLHRQGRRHDIAFVDPRRQLSRRSAGADQLRGRRQEAHLQDPQDHRWRGRANSGQDPWRRHRDFQFGILDRARDHRGQVGKIQAAGLWPQLELCRPFSRNLCPRLERPQQRLRWEAQAA